MAKKNDNPTILKKKERVRATTDLRGVPEGTEGRVMVANGLDWIRYWVEFDNGTEIGSLHRDKLVRTTEWTQYLVDRELAAERALLTTEAGDDASDDLGADAGSGGDGAVVNGVAVPQLLLDRTKSALERFGVSR